MINKIELQNFRGFKSFAAPLTPITIFGGKNNSGKTSLLEAIVFLYTHNDSNCFMRMNYLRHMNDQPLYTSARLWEPLFYNFDTKNKLSIILREDQFADEIFDLFRGENAVSDSNLTNIKNNFVNTGMLQQNYSLRFAYRSGDINESGSYEIVANDSNQYMPNFNPIFINYDPQNNREKYIMQNVFFFKPETMLNHNNLAQWFGQLLLHGKNDLVVKALKIFEPGIKDLQTIVQGAYGYLYAIFADGRKLPVSYMGDGMNRMLNILLGILSNPGSTVLIDEIENGFHYSMYQKLWELIGKAAMENSCQLIVNTHSRDLIQGAVDGLHAVGYSDKLSYNRLAKNDDSIEAKVFDSELIAYALKAEMEVR